MQPSFTKLAVMSMWLAIPFATNALELPPFGQLPELAEKWKLREQGSYVVKGTFQWHWTVFTNSENGDVLSFAAHRLEPGELQGLIYLSDTALESFSDGSPVWTRKSDSLRSGIQTIRTGLTKLHLAIDRKDVSQEAVELTFVTEGEDGTNRMAHGYALVFDDVAVLVQHMSTRPITPEFAANMATSLMHSNSRKPALKNPPAFRYSGGDGSSYEQAVTILGARNTKAGIAAENMWIQQKYPDARKTSQELQRAGVKRYDVIEFTAEDGKKRRVYFDVTDFFGK